MLAFPTAISRLPSPLKSPVARMVGFAPPFTLFAVGAFVKELVIGNNTGREVPPPGAGFTTVMLAVCAVAICEARIVAASARLLENFVVRAVPLKYTTEVEAKPIPVRFRVNALLPGATVTGFNCRIVGTALLAEATPAPVSDTAIGLSTSP